MRYYAGHQITIESYSATIGVTGGEEVTWSTYCTPYANIRYPKSSERLEGGRNTATRTAIFKVRHDSDTEDVTEKMRINYNGVWNILGVVFMGRDETIEITAQKKDG